MKFLKLLERLTLAVENLQKSVDILPCSSDIVSVMDKLKQDSISKREIIISGTTEGAFKAFEFQTTKLIDAICKRQTDIEGQFASLRTSIAYIENFAKIAALIHPQINESKKEVEVDKGRIITHMARGDE